MDLNHGLADYGYMHLFSLVVPCPQNEANLVVLSSAKPEAHQVMTGPQRDLRILATVLATHLGPEMPSQHGRVLDIAAAVHRAQVLTVREKQILSLLARGNRNERIAQELGLSEITVRTHLRNVRQKLKTPTREAALVKAVQLGLLPDLRRSA